MGPSLAFSLPLFVSFYVPCVVRMINFLSHFTWQNGRESERMEKGEQKYMRIYLNTHTSETHVKCVHMIYLFFSHSVGLSNDVGLVLRVRHFKFVRLTYLFAFIWASIIWMKWDVANFQLNVSFHVPCSCEIILGLLTFTQCVHRETSKAI